MPLFDEAREFKFWKAVRTEFLGTALLVIIGSSGGSGGGGDASAAVRAGLSVGLSVAALSQCCGHISGAHLNPAVTVAALSARNITVFRCAVYVLAQCVAGVCGSAVLYGLLPRPDQPGQPSQPDQRGHGPGVTRLSESITPVQGFGVEFLATFIYVFSYLANVDCKREDMGSRALYIGLTVTAAHLFAYDLTGAGMNPARSLGPSVIQNVWTNHWVYWVGPILAGFVASLTYEYTEDSSRSFEVIRDRFKKHRSLQEMVPNLQSMSNATDLSMANSTEMTTATTAATEDGRL